MVKFWKAEVSSAKMRSERLVAMQNDKAARRAGHAESVMERTESRDPVS
jgi:hypothetical protein